MGQKPHQEMQETCNIEFLKGIRVSSDTKNLIETINKVINTDKKPGDKLYTFMRIPSFYLICDIPYNDVYCPVPWFDVSNQNCLKNDLNQIKLNPPKFILYEVYSDLAIKQQEDLFLNGNRSVQRDFYSYFNEIQKDKYLIKLDFKQTVEYPEIILLELNSFI